MPRVSRHKSSKHSSRDAREYSDSEKETSSKDRKSSREESTSVKAFKETASGEKRKVESNKDYNKDSGNGNYLEEYSSSSKRRKERVEDDRWNGGGDDGNNNDRSEGTKKLKEKSFSESRSKRRDENAAGVAVEIEEVVKKSSGKSEGRHRELSSRKEGREGGIDKDRDRDREKDKDKDRDRDRDRERERDRRGKEGKSDKLIDGDDLRVTKQVYDKTELDVRDLLRSPEPDRRIKRKHDGSSDGDKYQDDIGDNDRRLSSREDVPRDGRPKDEKHRDERSRDKCHEDVDRESRHQDDKHRDEHAAKDQVNSRSDDKHSRDEKSTAEVKPKKCKPQDADGYHERERDRDFDLDRDHHRESYQRNRDCDREKDHGRDREHERDRDRDNERDREHDLDWDRGRDRDRDHERERDRDCNRERYRDQDRERDHDHERSLDYDCANVDDRGARYKDGRGRKRSPEYHDDNTDAKTRSGKTSYLDLEKKSLSSNRIESDTDRGRSQSRQAYPDNNKRRTSPSTSSHGAADEYRQYKQEELKYKDSVVEQRSKSISSREPGNLSGSLDRTSKYRSSEKPAKMDDGHMGEFSLERSSSSKASPMGLMERSPSSSLERNRYMNRSGVRRSLDIEESGRRSTASMGARDLSSADDRPNRDLPVDKSLADESTSIDSSFYNRNSQSNSTLIPSSSAFRGGVGSPSFLGSLEDARVNTGNRYKRSSDPSLGRGQGNGWRGAPNWSSPMPNGYMPFQHGPPHGGFQTMMPQFPSPPLFGVRPSMEINHSGIPYHIAEADRFSTHMRPLGWQNMMDGSRSSHMHGWDGNNGLFRDEAHIYGGPEWDQNRHPINDRGWENSNDIWKRQNGDQNFDLSSGTLKEDFSAQATMDDISAGQGGRRSQNESNHLAVQAKTIDTKVAANSSMEEFSKLSPKTIREETPDPPKLSTSDNDTYPYHAYLSKLDVSFELADPELYSQFMSLLKIEQNATVDEDTAVLINLKDGATALPKSCKTLLKSSLFPMTSDSVFQRAMEIYKRERASFGGLPIANGGPVDNIAASKIMEQVPDSNVNVVEQQTLIPSAETSHVQIGLDVKKVETVPNTFGQEHSHETVPIAVELEHSVVTPSQEMDVDAHTTDPKLELAGQAFPDRPLIIFNCNKTMDAVSHKPVDSGAPPQEDLVSTPEDVSDAANHLQPSEGKNVDEIGKIKGSNSLNFAEEGRGLDDGIGGSLVENESSPKISGDLMPESESVILSRIHHSPESTH